MIMESAWRLTNISVYMCTTCILTVLGFTKTSTLVGHFVPSSGQRQKRDRRDSREDEGRIGKKEGNERK